MNTLSKSLIILSLVTTTAFIASPSVHATTQPTCADGNKSKNLNVIWRSNSDVTIKSVGDTPLCDDLTLFFSSYTMPDNYNGKGFSDPSATPQTHFDSTSVVLKKNVVPSENLRITLPEACKNMQIDVYYGPQIKDVTVKGHGAQFIAGKMLVKTKASCAPVVTPPVTPTPTPVVPVSTPIAPVLPVVMSMPEIPAELPKTGTALDSTVAIAIILSVLTYAGTYQFTKRS